MATRDDSDKAHPDTPDSFTEAERFQRLFVVPLVEAVRVEVGNSIRPLASDVAELRKETDSTSRRLTAVESLQMKALIGWGVVAAAFSGVLTLVWDYISRKNS